MIESYLNQSGYRVNKGNWELFNAIPTSSPLTLTGTLPTVSFRCRATVISEAGHTDCNGSLVIGTETLAFTLTGQKKTTTILLTALPVVTYTSLDCIILIEAIDSAGASISSDNQVAIDCRFQDTQKSFQSPNGEWSTSAAIAYTNDTSSIIGTLFSYNGYDYQISQVSAYGDIGGDEEYRKLYLTGKTLAPSGRAVVVPEGTDMLKSVYDTDEDGIVDQSESVAISLITFETILAGNALCIGGGLAKKARATTLVPCMGFAFTNTAISTDAVVITDGIISPTKDIDLVADAPVYLSATTAGNVTPMPPSVAGQYMQKVGIAKTTSVMVIDIDEAIFLA